MHTLEHLVFRGDQYAYERRDGRFPYLDHAAAAGATGVHLWFWDEPFRAVAPEVIAQCRDLGLALHLGIGLGAYGVCDRQDPLDPTTMAVIQNHVARTLDTYQPAGLEFQTGEYDKLQYQGERVVGQSRATQLVETLNPYIDHALALRPALWVRTELHAGYFPLDQAAYIAAALDPRCTVEWSQFTGPYRGADCFDRGRALLRLDEQFTWFLKTVYNRCDHWRELASDDTLPELRKWAAHWRGWVKLLAEHRRPTLTICHVDHRFVAGQSAFASAAVALARDPDQSIEALLEAVLASSG